MRAGGVTTDTQHQPVGADAVLVVVFALDAQPFSVPLAPVERVVAAVEITPLPGAPDVVLGVIDVAGTVLPVLDLRLRLGRRPRELDVDDQFILLRTPAGRAALVVDRVISVSTLAIDDARPLGEACPEVAQVEGAQRSAEGLVLALDVDSLLSSAESTALDAALRTAVATAATETS